MITVSTFVHLPRMFLFPDFLCDKRIGLITMDLVYISLHIKLMVITRVFQAEQLSLLCGGAILGLCF